MSSPRLSRVVLEDLKSNVDPARRSKVSFWVTVLGKLLLSPQVHAVLTFRFAHALYRHQLLRVWAIGLKAKSLSRYGADIHPGATIGPGFCLVHTSGVVIGHGVVVGSNCRMHQGATLGEPGRGSRQAMLCPVVGDDVTIGAHAVIVGPLKVDAGAIIGANSVVVGDVPANAIVGGIPAKVLRYADVDSNDPGTS